MLARQGTTSAYAPGSSEAVRLVGDVAAMLSFGAGVIHISAAGDHTDLPVMFAGFMLVAALQIALGARLLRRPPSRLIIAAAVAMTVSSIGIWLVSRTAGLPFIEGGHLEPIGFKDGITKLLEIATIPLLLLLLSSDLARVSFPSPRLGGKIRATVGSACIALLVPALVLGGGTQHSHEQAVALGLHDAHDGSDAVAHAGSPHHTEPDHGAAQHPDGSHESSSGGHDTSHALGGHHSELASAPLGGTHQHGSAGAPGEAPTHHGDEHTGGRHEGGTHRDKSGGKHHGGHHGGGHDGHGEHEDPEPEPAITVGYEPQPSVCISGTLCVP